MKQTTRTITIISIIATTVAVCAVTNSIPDASRAAAKPRLIDLGATKCEACKMMAPVLEDLKTNCVDYFETVFIDVWENPAAGRTYDIKQIPTQIFFDAQGKELFRHEGFISKEDILKKWAELGVTAPTPAP